MEKPTIMQLAYLNGLYNRLNVPYSKRIKPQDKSQASTLIDELKGQIKEDEEKLTYEEEPGDEDFGPVGGD